MYIYPIRNKSGGKRQCVSTGRFLDLRFIAKLKIETPDRTLAGVVPHSDALPLSGDEKRTPKVSALHLTFYLINLLICSISSLEKSRLSKACRFSSK